ncbi:hypothetical protein Acor_55260 [Acrocarpospora corrugata]|uniref:Uncharacterized protein n=1 Tax=Acrocarpospora corrugata TaxID=35763 RepID=A0A5M3W5D4_9ACTN|nr:hypothetical protein Acor_55260 [Acrocarpospora corrugata]
MELPPSVSLAAAGGPVGPRRPCGRRPIGGSAPGAVQGQVEPQDVDRGLMIWTTEGHAMGCSQFNDAMPATSGDSYTTSVEATLHLLPGVLGLS